MMKNGSGNFGSLAGEKKMMQEIAQSADARALGELLSRAHSGDTLQKMAQNALSGDTSAMQDLMRSITDSPEGSELLRRLSESFQKG